MQPDAGGSFGVMGGVPALEERGQFRGSVSPHGHGWEQPVLPPPRHVPSQDAGSLQRMLPSPPIWGENTDF